MRRVPAFLLGCLICVTIDIYVRATEEQHGIFMSGITLGCLIFSNLFMVFEPERAKNIAARLKRESEK